MTRNVRLVATASILLALTSLHAVAADGDTRFIDDRWTFLVGGFLTDFRTDAAVGTGSVVGTVVRAEDDLGVDRRPSTFRLDGLFRINGRQSIGFGYWGLNRDGGAELEKRIEWDGNVYDVGARVESEFDTSWIRVDWRYDLLRTDRGIAGIAAGVSAYDFNLAVAGTATVDDGQGGVIEREAAGETGVLAPVPTVGLYVAYAFRPDLLLRLEANFLNLSYGDYEGRLVDTSTRLEWYFTDHVGIGGGFNSTDIRYKDRGEKPVSVDYQQSGLLAYLTLAF